MVEGSPGTSATQELTGDHSKPPLDPFAISAQIERNNHSILAPNRSNQSHISSTSYLETQEASQIQGPGNPLLHSDHSTSLSSQLTQDHFLQPQQNTDYNNIQSQSQSQSQSCEYKREQERGEDGYNWKRYGDKLVKGNRKSYYKCTFQGCPRKKTVETSSDGQFIEIVYNESHNHPSPRSNKRSLYHTLDDQSVEIDSYLVQEDNVSGSIGDEFDQGSPTSNHCGDNNYENEPLAKRWKRESEHGGGVIGARNRVVIQTTSDIDVLPDGYRWMKYGHKSIKGKPNPRSYYKCTALGCPVRKQVERASHDMRDVITSYEGKHTHDVPAAPGSGSKLKRTSAKAMQRSIRPAAVSGDSSYSNPFQEAIARPFTLPMPIMPAAVSDLSNYSNPFLEAFTLPMPIMPAAVSDLSNYSNPFLEAFTLPMPIMPAAVSDLSNYSNPFLEAFTLPMPIMPAAVSDLSNYSNPFLEAFTLPMPIMPAAVSDLSNYSNPFEGAIAEPFPLQMPMMPEPFFGHSNYSNPFEGAITRPFPLQMPSMRAPESGHSYYSNPIEGAIARPFMLQMPSMPASVSGHSNYSNPFVGAIARPFTPAPVSGHSNYSNPFQEENTGPFPHQMPIMPAPVSGHSSYSNPFQGATARPFTVQKLNNPIENDLRYQMNQLQHQQTSVAEEEPKDDSFSDSFLA